MTATRHEEDDEVRERGGEPPTSGHVVELEPRQAARPPKLAEFLNDAFQLMADRADGTETPITTPWHDFNAQLDGGFWPGCHVLVSGTGVGKSTWALQLALHTAQQGTHVVYVSLELDETQIALRLAAELANITETTEPFVRWSALYNGKASGDERAKAIKQYPALASLPIYPEAGSPSSWAPSRMKEIVQGIRQENPGCPLLVVLDFLQIVGAEEDERRLDLRERIGRAAYTARDIAREHKATVLLISSVARGHYEHVSGYEALKEAAITAEKDANGILRNFMYRPDAIVGMGKESGEIEYAADSVTVAVSLPREKASPTRPVVFATAKLRTGGPSWCALKFNGHRFSDVRDGGQSILKAVEEANDNPTTKPAQKQKSNGAPRNASNPPRQVE